MLNDARPVRIVAMSCCRSESAFSILVLMLASISFTELNTGPLGAACCSVFIAMCLRNAWRLMNYSAGGFTQVDSPRWIHPSTSALYPPASPEALSFHKLTGYQKPARGRKGNLSVCIRPAARAVVHLVARPDEFVGQI